MYKIIPFFLCAFATCNVIASDDENDTALGLAISETIVYSGNVDTTVTDVINAQQNEFTAKKHGRELKKQQTVSRKLCKREEESTEVISSSNISQTQPYPSRNIVISTGEIKISQGNRSWSPHYDERDYNKGYSFLVFKIPNAYSVPIRVSETRSLEFHQIGELRSCEPFFHHVKWTGGYHHDDIEHKSRKKGYIYLINEVGEEERLKEVVGKEEKHRKKVEKIQVNNPKFEENGVVFCDFEIRTFFQRPDFGENDWYGPEKLLVENEQLQVKHHKFRHPNESSHQSCSIQEVLLFYKEYGTTQWKKLIGSCEEDAWENEHRFRNRKRTVNWRMVDDEDKLEGFPKEQIYFNIIGCCDIKGIKNAENIDGQELIVKEYEGSPEKYTKTGLPESRQITIKESGFFGGEKIVLAIQDVQQYKRPDGTTDVYVKSLPRKIS